MSAAVPRTAEFRDMVESAIQPILFALEDLLAQSRESRVSSKPRPHWWDRFLALSGIEDRRGACGFKSKDLVPMLTRERASQIKYREYKRLTLGFSPISETDKRILSTLGDASSNHTDRLYLALDGEYKLIRFGLGVDPLLDTTRNSLEKGLELVQGLHTSAFDENFFFFDDALLLDTTRLEHMLVESSFGSFFDEKWVLRDHFTIGEYIAYQIRQSISASESLQHGDLQGSVKDITLACNFWSYSLNQSEKDKLLLRHVRDHAKKVVRECGTISSLGDFRRLYRDVERAGVTYSIWPLPGPLLADTSKHIIGMWRESVAKELVEEMECSAISHPKALNAGKRKKRSRSAQAVSSKALGSHEENKEEDSTKSIASPASDEVSKEPCAERHAVVSVEVREDEAHHASESSLLEFCKSGCTGPCESSSVQVPPIKNQSRTDIQGVPAGYVSLETMQELLNAQAAMFQTTIATEIARVLKEVSCLSHDVLAFRETMESDFEKLRANVFDMQRGQQQIHAQLIVAQAQAKPAPVVVQESPLQTKGKSPSSSVPSSPRNTATPLLGKSLQGHGVQETKPHNSSIHLRRASMSEAPYTQQRMSMTGGSAWSFSPSSPSQSAHPASIRTQQQMTQQQQYQTHHPSAGVLYSKSVVPTNGTANTKSPTLGSIQTKRTLNEADVQRPHEWHGSNTLFFPPLSETTSKRKTNESENSSQASVHPSQALLERGRISPETFILPPLASLDLLRDMDASMVSKLSQGMAQFVEHCKTQRMLKSTSEQAALESIRIVVQSVWPRARVKGFGSTVTGLSLPMSDMDVVVCLPKVTVMKDAIAEEVGPLEGHEERISWQEKLAAALLQAPWVEVESLRTIQHAPMPVITFTTKGPPYFEVPVSLDVTFHGETHFGLATNKLVHALQREHRLLRPMVLVLKQFLADRGLGKGFSGGLSSYALVIMCTCFLHAAGQELGLTPAPGTNSGEDREEPSDETVGKVLLCFFRFFGEHFDPRNTGISIARGFFPRYGPSPQMSTTPPTLAQQSQQHRRRSFRIEDLHPPTPLLHHPGGQAWLGGAMHHAQEAVPPHKFDPLLIEDPLQPGNNVGRNVFRVHQIQRACADAVHGLLSPMSSEWPLGCLIASWIPGHDPILQPRGPIDRGDGLNTSSSVNYAGGGRGRANKMVSRSNSVV